jgi:hypothetical protein
MWELYGRWAWFYLANLRQKYNDQWVALLDPGTRDNNFGGSDTWLYEKQEVGQGTGVFQWRKISDMYVKDFYYTPYNYEHITVTSAEFSIENVHIETTILPHEEHIIVTSAEFDLANVHMVLTDVPHDEHIVVTSAEFVLEDYGVNRTILKHEEYITVNTAEFYLETVFGGTPVSTTEHITVLTATFAVESS